MRADQRSGRFYRRRAGTAAGGAAAALSSDKMATPSELSLEEIRKYLLENGGTARNHDVVKYFKRFLTDPETRGTSKRHRGIRSANCLDSSRCDLDVAPCAVCKHGTRPPTVLVTLSEPRNHAQFTNSRYSRGTESVQGIREHPGHYKERRGASSRWPDFPSALTAATCCARRDVAGFPRLARG